MVKKPLNNFTLENCLFIAINILKNGNPCKWVYSGYRTAFDWKGVLIEKSFSWSFVDDLARNIVIFYADNKSSSHSNNCKNNTLILGEGPPSDINSRFGFQEKKI